jgi:hypothetical protein
MSIKDSAFKFHQTIWNSPNREEVRKVVAKLKSSTRGYGNKVSPAPILGLLLYDQNRLKKFAGIAPSEELLSWPDQDLKVLFGVHEQIRMFNERCLKPLSLRMSEAIEGINPYKRYPYRVSIEGFEEFLFKPGEAEEVIESFHTHPAFEIALSTVSAVGDRPLDYEGTISQLNNEIVNAGPGGQSKWVEQFEEARRWDYSHLDMFRHAGALLCLHNALANLDELVYLSLFQEELLHIDRRQIIDYMWTTGGAGPTMWVMHIPYGHMFIFEVTDLITVNIDKPGEKSGLGDKLCEIQMQTIPGTMMGPGTLKLRMIDENLSAYSYLIK